MTATKEPTFRLGWMQTLNGFKEILETGIPASEALKKKAALQRDMAEAFGAVAFIEPEEDEETA